MSIDVMDDGDDEDSEEVVVDRKRGRADSKYSLKKQEKDAKKKGRVLVEVQITDILVYISNDNNFLNSRLYWQ